MKKYIWGIFGFLLYGCSFVHALEGLETSTIYTTDKTSIIDTEFIDGEGNPMRKGINGATNGKDNGKSELGGVRKEKEIKSFEEAKTSTMDTVKKFINYILSFVSFVALIYLLAHGFMVMTAMDDDAKVKKGMAGIKTAGIAIGGIAGSWMIVSLIFFIIKSVTGG